MVSDPTFNMPYYYIKYGNLEDRATNKKIHLASVSLQTSTLPSH